MQVDTDINKLENELPPEDEALKKCWVSMDMYRFLSRGCQGNIGLRDEVQDLEIIVGLVICEIHVNDFGRSPCHGLFLLGGGLRASLVQPPYDVDVFGI